MKLSQYGPGKFNLHVDTVAYCASLDGCAEECGDVESTGHYAKVDGPFTDPENTHLSADDTAFLAQQHGAIVSECSQGFVSVEWFTDAAELAARWNEIETAVAEIESEDFDAETASREFIEGEE